MVANTSWESLEVLFNEMRPILVKAGIQAYLRQRKYRIDALNRAFDWLHRLKMSKEYREFLNIWLLLPEEVWKRYKLFQISELREQELLKEASRKLRIRWQAKRPAIFNKKKERKING